MCIRLHELIWRFTNEKNYFKIHHINIQWLAIELFKVFKVIANPVLNNSFSLRSMDYQFRYQNDFSVNCVNISYFGLSSSIVLIMVPPELKNVNEVNV